MVAWRTSFWLASHFSQQTHSITLKLQLLSDGFTTWLTTVYGPQSEEEKIHYLQELRAVRQHKLGAWMLCGDFNLIYNVADKNNNLLNRRMMGHFRRFLSDLELKELHLHGRLYTWSNERAHPTFERIDRIFVSLDWVDRFPNHLVRALSTDGSDHAPLLLATNTQPSSRRRFRFESIWPRLPGYLETVTTAWQGTLRDTEPCRVLDHNL